MNAGCPHNHFTCSRCEEANLRTDLARLRAERDEWRSKFEGMDALLDARGDGGHACSDGKWQDENPHPYNSDLYKAWEIGWADEYERQLAEHARFMSRGWKRLAKKCAARVALARHDTRTAALREAADVAEDYANDRHQDFECRDRILALIAGGE